MKALVWLGLLLSASTSFSQVREIALTIDDLPLVASQMNTPGNIQRSTERFQRMVQTLSENKIPATGFVIAGAIEKGQWEFLEQFRQAGLQIGNHTYSHRGVSQVGAEKYIADVDRADKRLTTILTEPKYFRYPYLDEGNKKNKPLVQKYLAEHKYIIAPVTIDSKDFEFNEQVYKSPFRVREQTINRIKPRYLAYMWQQTLKAEKRAKDQPVKQILLIHANILNSYALEDIIKMYQKNGYKFITLSEALEHPAPAITYPSPESNGESIIEKVISSENTVKAPRA